MVVSVKESMRKESNRLFRELEREYKDVEMYQYCKVVFKGKYPTAKKTKQGCLRTLRMLKEGVIKLEEGDFEFNKTEARKIINFSKLIKLRKENKYFRPSLYQAYILQQTAWLDEDYIRLIQKMYLSMGRKQGKSYLVAIILAFEFLVGKVPSVNKSIVMASRSERQSKIIYGMVSEIFRDLIKERAAFNGKEIGNTVQVKKGVIENIETGAKIEFFSSEADGIDGSEPDVGVIDEYAMMRNGAHVRGAIQQGQNSVLNPLLIFVSTVSDDLNSDMYKEYGLVTDILSGDFDSPRYFVYIAELEDKEEVKDELNWSKANPLLVQEEIRGRTLGKIKQDMAEEMHKGMTMEYFLVKVFNMWGKTSESKYLDYEIWEDSSIESYSRYGKKVYIGIDLSERSDLTGIGFIFLEDDYFYIDSHAFVAGRKSDKGKDYLTIKGNADQFDYVEANKEGHVSISESLIDYKSVWEYVLDYIEDYNLDLQGIYVDPKLMESFQSAKPRGAEDIVLVYVRQGLDELTMPLTEFRDNLIDGRIKHSNNSFLNYCVKNAEVKARSYGMLIGKPTETLRIDSLDAVITAYYDLSGHNFDNGSETYWDDLESQMEGGVFSF